MLVLCTDASKGAATVEDKPSGLGRAHWVFLYQLIKDASVSGVKGYICGEKRNALSMAFGKLMSYT
jgi:hypothetical protein